MKKTAPAQIAIALLLGSSALAWAHGDHGHSHDHGEQRAHVHGVANLDIAVDANEMVAVLNIPMADVVGFEHAPQDDKQRQQVQVALENLRNAGQWLKPSAQAGCTLAHANLHAPTLDAKADDHDHDHDHDHQHDKTAGHADLEAVYTFQCANTEATKLQTIDVELFRLLPSLATINVQTALPQGQNRQTLTPASQRLTLKP